MKMFTQDIDLADANSEQLVVEVSTLIEKNNILLNTISSSMDKIEVVKNKLNDLINEKNDNEKKLQNKIASLEAEKALVLKENKTFQDKFKCKKTFVTREDTMLVRELLQKVLELHSQWT